MLSNIEDLKIGKQIFKIKDYIYARKLKDFNLYVIGYSYEPLFFISPVFAATLLEENIIYADGLVKIGGLRNFLKDRKVIFKNCYYDLAYKNTTKFNEDIKRKITNNENIFL